MFSNTWSKKEVIVLVVAIVILFMAADIFYWAWLDGFKSPIRDIRGDSSLYLYQLNSVLNFGRPAGAPYFIENNFEQGRFYLFGKLFSFLPGIENISAVGWMIIFRGAVPVLVFLILTAILKNFSVQKHLAYISTLIFVFFYGPMAFKGGGSLQNWFLPAFLMGILLIVKFYKAERPRLLWLPGIIASVIFFSFHPVYFSFGILFSTLVWIKYFTERPEKKRIVVFFIIWLGAVLYLFSLVFSPFIFSKIPEFTAAASSMTARNTFLATRFPFLFLFGVRSLLLVLISLWLFRIKKDVGLNLKRNYFLILALAVVYFICLNSYILTGKYFLNDHYPFVEDFIILPLVLVLLSKDQLIKEKFGKLLGWLLLFFVIISGLVILNSHNFKPVYTGRWLSLFIVYGLIISLLSFPKIKEFFIQKRGSVLIKILLVASLAHIIFINWWDDRYWLPLHQKAQAYRPVIETIKGLPAGVILANSQITNLALIYTNHKVYWSPIALHDLVGTDELYDRWLNAKIVFPEEPAFNERSAVFSVFGSRDNKCREFKRYIYLNWLSRLGIEGPKRKICDDSLYQKWPEMEKAVSDYANQVKIQKKWDPNFKLDYLIVEKGRDTINSDLVKRYFSKTNETEKLIVYKVLPLKNKQR